MGTEKTFPQQLAALKRQFPQRHSQSAAGSFLDLHLRWAAAVEKSDPLQAVEQLKMAEGCQGTLGTFSTGSGEGLASMMELYDLMARRARLEEGIAASCANPPDACLHLEAALQIWTEIQSDPNGLVAVKDLTPLKVKIRKLKARIS